MSAPARQAARGSADTKELISKALALLKEGGGTDRSILAEWAGWLGDVKSYVTSLDDLGQATLKRVVISSGQWLIVFEDPIEAFITPGPPSERNIHCFLSSDEIVTNYRLIYDLLYRKRLVDTLAPVISEVEALSVLSPAAIEQYFRGVAVATNMAGAARGLVPARIVYPALLVNTGNRIFAVVHYGIQLQEPVDQQQFATFYATLNTRATAFEARFLGLMGQAALTPQPLSAFPGFPVDRPEGSFLDLVPPEPGSTVDFAGDDADGRISFVSALQDESNSSMYVVATGPQWFYKIAPAGEPTCVFHDWRAARAQGAGSNNSLTTQGKMSMTTDGEEYHCAHEHLRSRRSARCHIEPLESHLCCRSCVFYDGCWVADAQVLPCAPRA